MKMRREQQVTTGAGRPRKLLNQVRYRAGKKPFSIRWVPGSERSEGPVCGQVRAFAALRPCHPARTIKPPNADDSARRDSLESFVSCGALLGRLFVDRLLDVV